MDACGNPLNGAVLRHQGRHGAHRCQHGAGTHWPRKQVSRRAIAHLEHTLGVRRLDRSRRGVEPTPYGRALVKRGVAIFDELRQGVQDIAFLTDPTAGEIRVGGSDPMVSAIISPVVHRLAEQYSRMSFRIIIADLRMLCRELDARHIDVALWHSPPVRGAAGIPSGYRGTCALQAPRPAHVLMTLADPFHLRLQLWLNSPPTQERAGAEKAEGMNIHESTRLYEDWLQRQLKGDAIKSDLARKREKMKEGPFVFLRATYWRWAETILDVCPDLARAPEVLAIGDAHLENYGTWRDVDGRLAWGVNDFDEAAPMPYALDLVRLAASALLAGGRHHVSAENICARILEGYADGLRDPRPIVLDRDYAWLREKVIVTEKARAKFWRKIAEAKEKAPPARYRRALTTAMPEPRLALRIVPRSAGAGSLGRPRWVGIAEWRGAPVVREAKALVRSAWLRARGGRTGKIYVRAIVNGCFRSLDPWFNVNGGIAVRRLSPNNRKIEAENAVEVLLMPEMLRTMGFEIANVHTGAGAPRAEISNDLRVRKREWLAANAKKAAEAVTRDHADWTS